MTNDPINILCTGDVHLGRHPTRIPPQHDGPQFSPRTLWDATIDHAIQTEADALIVTGDIVDRENRYYEAYGPIEDAAHRLNDAAIPLITVAGNHDYDGLPRVIDALDLPNIHLLGENGTWERHTLHDEDDEPRLTLHGWSFPTQHVHRSPLETYDLDPHPETPTIGLLHADLDATEDHYAPITTQELLETNIDAWLLGHIHRPPYIRREEDPLILYPGSPQPLNPNEHGPHGPWRITLQTDGTLTPQQHPLATLRYEAIPADATNANDAKDIPPIITQTLRENLPGRLDTRHLELLLPRITLEGRTPAHTQIQQQRDALEDQLASNLDTIPYHVETLTVDTRPPIDLDALDDDTPTGYLANLIQALDDEDPSRDHQALIQDALDAMHEAREANAYTDLRRQQRAPQPRREDALDALRRQALALLDVLLAQKEVNA